MTRRRDRRPLRRLAVGFILVVAALPLLVLSRSGTGVGQESESPLTAQSQLGVPDNGGTIFGASGSEAPGEVWSIGDAKLLRGSDAGWSVVPAPTGTDGQPVSSFSPAAGRSTPDGAVVVLSDKGLVVRDPGGAFHVAPDPETAAAPATTSVPGSTSTPPTTTDPGSTGTPGSTATPPATDQPPLLTGEALYSGSHVLLAPAEQDGHAGAYVVPTAGDDKAEDAVLRFDGTKWTREDICMDAASPCAKPQDDTFKVVAIDTAGPGDAWLLATGTPSSDGIVLFRRQAADGGDPPTWRPVSRGTSPFADAAPTVGGTTVHLSPRAHGQALTATTQGAWVDATVKVGSSQDEQDATFFYDESGGSVAGTWCDVAVGTATLCDHPLGAPLPSGDGRSFAWADGSAFGRRVITGLPQGVILRLGGATFDEVPTLGGTLGTASGAAFAADDDGWLGGRAPARITRTAQTVGLRAWPVPFRHTLTAIAPEPGKAIAAIDSSALAVGDDGEVARYSPGAGWQPEYLTSASGARATPRLRGVAWPTPDRAYAVGDGAEMWLWRRATGLWEPDPAKPPNLALANFNGIAFDPGNPDRGYAIGKQGVLLRYDRQWTQEPLPDGLDQANFTSIAFAGHEAIVTYQLPLVGQAGVSYTGGVIVNDGSGWRRDQGVTDVLPASDGGRSVQQAPVPIRAAGLPDGSAAVATIGGIVVERSGATGPWTRTPATPSGFPTALAAFHDESGAVRAVVSLDLGVQTAEELASTDSDVILNPPAPGQPPILTDPYKLPHAGMVLRETVSGWHDDQHQYYEDAGAGTGLTRDYDQPEQPDAVQAFLIDPFGRNGWGVGGQTGDLTSTAGVVRYPDDGAAPPGTTDAPIVTDGDKATFAIGGGAQCLDACAALEQVGAGPWRWLPAAVGRAAQTSGVRAFLYTGDGIAPGQSGSTLTREEGAYARRLTERAGALPVFAAAASSDLGPDGRLDAFRSAFDAAATAPLGSGAPVDTITTDDRPRPGQGYYSFDSTGSTGPGGNVRVIFVDASSGQLGDDQRCWLATQLSEAAMESAPAIVIGSRPVDAVNTASPAGPGTVDGLADAAAVSQILVTGAAPPGCTLPGAQGGASAYFYNFPNENRSGVVTFGDDQIPAYGSGSLGYVVPEASQETHNPGASGWLLAEVDVASRDPSTNRAPVAVPRLIPNVGEIAVEASDGTLLRRSQVALFDGLARRPRSGLGCYGAPSCIEAPSQYLPIPFTCIGSPCESTLAPDYSFTSSDPTVADFVAHDPTSLNPRRVLIGPDKKPVPAATGGLLCAYNPGTTTITLTAGGMSYSQKVTVLAGSVQQPCGTVPANGTRTSPPRGGEDPIQNPLPTEPTTAPPVGGVTPIPPPPVPAVHATPVKHVPPAQRPPVPLAVAPFVPISSGLTQVVAIPPPPPPTAARPAPPSGTSSANVYQSAVAPERQRDEEHAVDHAHNMVRYEPDATRLVVMRGGAVLMLILGGLALAGARPRPRRNYAYNTTDRRSPRS